MILCWGIGVGGGADGGKTEALMVNLVPKAERLWAPRVQVGAPPFLLPVF